MIYRYGQISEHAAHSRIRRNDDESYGYHVDIVADLAEQDGAGERGFLLQTHLGNYSLWLAGLFPDFTGEVFEGLHHLNTSHQAEPDRVAATLVPFWERSEAGA